MNSIGIYFVLYAFIILGILFYAQSFICILNFKWYTDMYYARDKACLKTNWAKYEIETYRYNLYRFLLYPVDKTESYENIFQTYKNSHYLFISFFAIFLLVCLIIIVYFNLSRNTEDILFTYISYFVLLVMYIIYTTINTVLLSKFESIQNMLGQENNAIQIYHNVYTILNALLYISDTEDIILEYTNEKLNEIPITFDTILHQNIAAYENLSNTSKIVQLKNVYYENLDFVKFFTFDKLSAYFSKYFKNPFIRLPEYSELQYDISQNLYLTDLYSKRNNSVNYEVVKLEFDKIVTALKDEKRETYVNIRQHILINYPDKNEYQPMSDCYEMLFRLFTKDKALEEYNVSLATEIRKYIQNIDNMLKSHHDNTLYIQINSLIHKTLIEKNKELNLGNLPKNRLDILNEDKPITPVQDYIKYYLHNQDILFDSESERSARFYDWTNLINSYANYIYAYFLYFIFIFCTFSHYLYHRINDTHYVFIMIGLIGLYFSYGYMRYLRQYL